MPKKYNTIGSNEPIPYDSNNSNKSTRSLFESKAAYAEVTLQHIRNTNFYQIPFVDLYKKNALYGFIDNDADVVIPISINTNFTTVYIKEGIEQKIQNFVADAFYDMKAFIRSALSKGALNKSSIYKNLNITKSYYDMDKAYRNNHYLMIEDFKIYAFRNKDINSKITDHKSFVKQYIQFLRTKINTFPVTKSQTVLYFNFHTFPSGLVFDTAIDRADDDEIKYKKYLTDFGFSIFSEACLRFGFGFDQNVPWRLYADLNSPSMKPYLKKYFINNVDDLFLTRYKKVYIDDLIELKTAFYRSYLIFIENNTFYNESYRDLCSSNVKYFERPKISYEEFIKDLPDQFWVRAYAYFRNYETLKNLTQNQFENIVREANEFTKYDKSLEAIKYLNEYFKEYKFLNDASQSLGTMVELPVSSVGLNEIIL